MGRGDDTRKLQELILYVAEKMERDHHAGIGRIKLAKLLWRIDFSAYWKLGLPVTETEYVADKLGPVPVDELLATRDVEAAGRFEWVQEWDQQRLPRAVKSADATVFSSAELGIIDEVVDRFRGTSGTQMVDDAHAFPGWIHAWQGGAGRRDPIPYDSIFWSRDVEITPEDESYGHELAADFRHLIE